MKSLHKQTNHEMWCKIYGRVHPRLVTDSVKNKVTMGVRDDHLYFINSIRGQISDKVRGDV